MRFGMRLLGVMVVTACLVGVMASAATAGADEPRPFHFSEQADFYVDGECSPGVPLQVITGTGIGSHLGRVSIAGEACLGADSGNVAWTAANEDEINIRYRLVLLAPPGQDGSAPIELHALEVTGTGRFENVRLGDEPLSGTIWFFDPLGLAGHLEAEVMSTIIYDASDRGR